MANQENTGQAVKLMDEMVNLSDGERYVLKKRVIEAAQGGDAALGHIILFPYDHRNRDIVSEVLHLILGN